MLQPGHRITVNASGRVKFEEHPQPVRVWAVAHALMRGLAPCNCIDRLRDLRRRYPIFYTEDSYTWASIIGRVRESRAVQDKPRWMSLPDYIELLVYRMRDTGDVDQAMQDYRWYRPLGSLSAKIRMALRRIVRERALHGTLPVTLEPKLAFRYAWVP